MLFILIYEIYRDSNYLHLHFLYLHLYDKFWKSIVFFNFIVFSISNN
jgi:hypothetical protein